eukprot:TRINITY_DN3003_c0_g1_i1.p1 TRINITY_DN3003_c0_g1~~TRINITY_DN3003_c0_g1_i1.p1  ORF type:complete len:1289 (-),score=252.87 TRINITY_DN3003_c0_g1_i1:164-4030(-)
MESMGSAVKHTIKRNPVIAKVKAADAKRKHKEGSRKEYPIIHFNDEEANGRKANNFPSNTFTTAKYSLWSFPFKVLWEQFRKATTIYFTIIVVISLIPQISPITPWTSIMGLLFIIVVAAVREGWEDFLRHKADRKVNQRRYHLVEAGSVGERVVTRSRWLAVGNLVYVKCDQQIPADMVVLTTSDPDHLCYIETSQLDGETNLKIRRSPAVTADMSLEEIASIKGTIQCEAPHHQLYVFKASMSVSEDAKEENAEEVEHDAEQDTNATALDQANLLLQSSFLRNTEWALGIVVYAGPETKLSLNQKKPPSKMSRLDTRLNYYVYILFIINMILCLASAVAAGIFEWKVAGSSWYLPTDTGGPWLMGLKMFFSYFALLSYLIPLSLVVSLEMVKVFQARYMEWDEQLFKDDTGMTVKTSNLNDELGLVQYIFSDKTGTLTENQMDFKQCSVNGVIYDEDGVHNVLSGMGDKDGEAEAVRNYVLAMALAHSAVTDKKKSGELIYKASSPDEEALCKAAHQFGYSFISRTSGGVTLNISSPGDQKRKSKNSDSDTDDGEEGEEVLYEQLCMMEFTSDRRRMSVIVRTPDGEIKLLSKGADSVMFERLASGQDELKAKSSADLDSFSQNGLRTLVYAEKTIPKEEWASFDKEYQAASNLIEGREEAVEELCDKIERDLTLVGCSAIEDKLQPYVPETIDYLLKAGIKVWVITGDKQDTAINIGFSSKLLNSSMKICKINATSSKKTRRLLVKAIQSVKGADYEVPYSKKKKKKAEKKASSRSGYKTLGEKASDSEEGEDDADDDDVDPSQVETAKGEADDSQPKKLACVIDGGTLKYALKDWPDELVEFTTLCHSVVCCRVTPLQKAKVVRLVRQSQKAVCLSIGDGANDVSMIQEANIGVGIYGKEGNQAARASDFALRQFSHLRRLICIHGRYSMLRNAFLIHYSLYKNAAVFLAQLWFACFCGFSGQTLYDDWIMTFFNITITAAPPLAVGVYEIDIYEHIIDKHPELYARTQKNEIFTLKSLSIWMLSALYQSLVAFFGTYIIYAFSFAKGGIWLSGQDAGFYVMGNVVLLVGMAGIFLKLFFHVTHWNWVVQVAVYGSVLIYIVTVVLENVISYFFPNQYFVFFYMLTIPSTWLWLVLSVVIILLPDLVAKFVKRAYYPEDWQVLQELDWLDKHPRKRKKGADAISLAPDHDAKSYGVRERSINNLHSDSRTGSNLDLVASGHKTTRDYRIKSSTGHSNSNKKGKSKQGADSSSSSSSSSYSDDRSNTDKSYPGSLRVDDSFPMRK